MPLRDRQLRFFLEELSFRCSLYSRLSNPLKRALPNSARLSALLHSALVQQADIFTNYVLNISRLVVSYRHIDCCFDATVVFRVHYEQQVFEFQNQVSVYKSLPTKAGAAMYAHLDASPVMADGSQRCSLNTVSNTLISNDTDGELYQADKAASSSMICNDLRVSEAGADHNLTLIGGFKSVRAQTLTANVDGGARKFGFTVNNDTNFNSSVACIQSLAIRTATRIDCSLKAT